MSAHERPEPAPPSAEEIRIGLRVEQRMRTFIDEYKKLLAIYAVAKAVIDPKCSEKALVMELWKLRNAIKDFEARRDPG